MRELNLEEVRNIQLNILKEVADFCEKNDITYFLCGGTLLGAIRHKGYIPWDDDIDIMLPRPDYERLLETFVSQNLTLYTHNTRKGYNRPFAKISDNKTKALEGSIVDYEIGVNIDLFPLDGFPDSSILTGFHIRKILLLRFILRILLLGKRKPQNMSFLKSLVGFISKVVLKSHLVSIQNILKAITETGKKYKFESSRRTGISIWGYGKREVCEKSVFSEQIDVLFEGSYFKGLKDYDTYLANVYGDYMKLPPQDQRKAHLEKYFMKSESSNKKVFRD